MSEATRVMIADVAASFLLALAFLLLVATIVALFLVWRGLRAVRGEMRPAMERAVGLVGDLQNATDRTARGVVMPPIVAASIWAGLKAGARSFVGAHKSDGAKSGPPPL